jgi:hydroxyacylglutathione hydrolase
MTHNCSLAAQSLQIRPIPAFQDNYIWMLVHGEDAAVVDPGEAAPVLKALQRDGLTLTDIVVTHHHRDHVGGVAELYEASGARVWGPAREDIPCRRYALSDGDPVELFGHTFTVIDVPGHTLGHIALHAPSLDALLCGDTLFAGGCGRVFEGTPQQMLHSLSRLAALPPQTRVYCAHEYTLANLRFARAVEPGNDALARRQQFCQQQRDRGEPTVPSTIDVERATNPFLRCNEPAVRAAAEHRSTGASADAVSTFATIRAWKNSF